MNKPKLPEEAPLRTVGLDGEVFGKKPVKKRIKVTKEQIDYIYICHKEALPNCREQCPDRKLCDKMFALKVGDIIEIVGE